MNEEINEKSIFFLGKRNEKIETRTIVFGFEKVFFVKEVIKIEDVKKEENKDYDIVLIKTNNVETLRRMIDKASNYFEIFILGTSDKINRAALEHKRVRALVSPEYARAFDYKDYRNSGLNQVLCKIAHDNNKMIVENFSEFLKKDKKEKALLLGRILQNAKLCKKYKTNFIIALFIKDIEEMVSYYELINFKKILV